MDLKDDEVLEWAVNLSEKLRKTPGYHTSGEYVAEILSPKGKRLAHLIEHDPKWLEEFYRAREERKTK